MGRRRNARTEWRCVRAVDAAGLSGSEMSKDPLDEFGSLDARDNAQRSATHLTVRDVDVEDVAVVPATCDPMDE